MGDSKDIQSSPGGGSNYGAKGSSVRVSQMCRLIIPLQFLGPWALSGTRYDRLPAGRPLLPNLKILNGNSATSSALRKGRSRGEGWPNDREGRRHEKISLSVCCILLRRALWRKATLEKAIVLGHYELKKRIIMTDRRIQTLIGLMLWEIRL